MEDDIHIQGLPDEFYIPGGPTNELEDFRVRRTGTFSSVCNLSFMPFIHSG